MPSLACPRFPASCLLSCRDSLARSLLSFLLLFFNLILLPPQLRLPLLLLLRTLQLLQDRSMSQSRWHSTTSPFIVRPCRVSLAWSARADSRRALVHSLDPRQRHNNNSRQPPRLPQRIRPPMLLRRPPSRMMRMCRPLQTWMTAMTKLKAKVDRRRKIRRHPLLLPQLLPPRLPARRLL